MLSPWTRRARSRETLRPWSIENTWRALNSAGPRVRSVNSTGITASVCGETIRRTTEAGFGGGFGFEHEFSNGWTPFGRFATGTTSGTAIKQVEGIGLARVRPFGRRGDMFGLAFNSSEPSRGGRHHESVFESFYRLRLTQRVKIGPDIEVSIHPTYAVKPYTTTLLGARMEMIF